MTLWAPDQLGSAFFAGFRSMDTAGANAGAEITQAAGAVSQWSDWSGNGRHITESTHQPTYSATGLNSLPALVFGGNQFLTKQGYTALAVGTVINVFAVAKVSNVGADNRVVSFLNSATAPDYNGSDSYIPLIRNNTSISIFKGGAYATGTAFTYDAASVFGSTALTAGAMRTWVNGTAGTAAGTLSSTFQPDTFGIGADPAAYFDGSLTGAIAEVVIVTGEMTTADIDRVHGYLAWKYGLQASLPSGHTYASAAPTVSGGSGATGSGSYTEAADTASGAGTRGATGSGGATEGGDTGAGSGASGSTGSGAYTEAADTAAGSGTVASGAGGSGAYTENQDTAAGAGASGSTGSGSSTEGGDTGSGAGTAGAFGSGSYTEGQDTGAGSGNASSPATGSGSYTEAGDTAVGYAPGLDPNKVAGGGAGYTLEDWAEAAKQKRKRKKGKKGGELLEQIAEGRQAAEAHKAAVLAELTAPVNTELNTAPAEVAPDGPTVLQASDPVPAPPAAPTAIEISIKPELDELLLEIRADMQRAVHDIIGHFRLTTSALSSEVRTLQRENAELRRHMAILSDDLETYQAFALAQASGKVH